VRTQVAKLAIDYAPLPAELQKRGATMAAPNSAQHETQGLPSITSLTNGLPRAQVSPDQQSLNESTRDSGTWPQPHISKRKSQFNEFLILFHASR
jgi:hypothetical protein